jgi:hypothetical protein
MPAVSNRATRAFFQCACQKKALDLSDRIGIPCLSLSNEEKIVNRNNLHDRLSPNYHTKRQKRSVFARFSEQIDPDGKPDEIFSPGLFYRKLSSSVSAESNFYQYQSKNMPTVSDCATCTFHQNALAERKHSIYPTESAFRV